MFIDILVVLTGAESAIFLSDKEEGRHLWGVEWANLSRGKDFVKEIFSSFSCIRRERVHLSYFWGKGVVEVDLMVIRSGGGNMVGSFF